MLFGAHVSIQGGIHNAPANAADLGCDCFQIFSRSPRGGPAKSLSKEIIHAFREACERSGQKAWYIHTPYYINLATNKRSLQSLSIRIVREELERGCAIGADAVMTHMGSCGDDPKTGGLDRCIHAVTEVLTGYRGKTKLLVEIAAGSGGIIGSTFEELACVVERTRGRCGVCFDTQHAFASGYDLRTPRAVQNTVDEFDAVIGLQHLKLSHCNDSLTPLGSRKDRHSHIGEGLIGDKGFRAIVRNPRLQQINLILETKPAGVTADLKLLKGFSKR
ncbi:MAG: deoxyribonuclease IV [Candidatus Latescibacterota bacterium]